MQRVQLTARHDLVGSTPVVSLEGVVDLATVPTLHDQLRRAVTEHPGQRMAVDLDGVTALDDCGLGILLGIAGHAREGGGDLTVVTTSDRLRRRFATTGLDRAVDVCERI